MSPHPPCDTAPMMPTAPRSVHLAFATEGGGHPAPARGQKRGIMWKLKRSSALRSHAHGNYIGWQLCTPGLLWRLCEWRRGGRTVACTKWAPRTFSQAVCLGGNRPELGRTVNSTGPVRLGHRTGPGIAGAAAARWLQGCSPTNGSYHRPVPGLATTRRVPWVILRLCGGRAPSSIARNAGEGEAAV